MMLFPASSLKSKPKSCTPGRDKRPRARIPTGAPRLVESSSDRAARVAAETWGTLLDTVRRSASARFALLQGWSGRDQIACPWERITGCDVSCRCGGTGTVLVEFLRTHYAKLAVEIATLVRPTSVRSCQ